MVIDLIEVIKAEYNKNKMVINMMKMLYLYTDLEVEEVIVSLIIEGNLEEDIDLKIKMTMDLML